jgi:hypothetical protein
VNPTAPNDPQLGTLMLADGLISDSQLLEALRTQSDLDAYRPLGQILVDQKAISVKQLNLFIDKHHKRARLGDILLKSKIITGEQLEIALSYQKTTGLPLEEMLAKLNYINEETMRQALCKHLNIPFIDLGKCTIEPSLRKLINKSYAKNDRVIPLPLWQIPSPWRWRIPRVRQSSKSYDHQQDLQLRSNIYK